MKRILLSLLVVAASAVPSYAGGLSDLLASYRGGQVQQVSSAPYVQYGSVPVRLAAFQQPATSAANAQVFTPAPAVQPLGITTLDSIRSTGRQCQSGDCDR